GNPHSGNPSSEHMADIVHQVRGTVLNHFNVTNDQYDCVFTSGATGALRVLAENFEWTKGKSKFVYLEDNHTSVVGIREPVETQNCEAWSKSPFHLQNYDAVKVKEQNKIYFRVGNIFAYPAQSNFSGTKYPLFWISEVKKGEAFNLSKLITTMALRLLKYTATPITRTLAASKNIHLRSGCFCNVGACVSMLNLTPENMKTIFQSGHSCGDHIDIVDGKPVGAIRASLGYMSSTRDVDSLVQFIKESFLQENNLSAEVNDEVYYDARSSVSDSSKALTLEKIFLYPVKSCRAIEVKQWTLCETGLTHDRMWMIVNDYGVCLTQKRENLLALIQPSIDLEAGTLTLESESCGSVEVPLNADDRIDGSVDINVCESKVCGDRVSGYDCGEKVSKWLSEFLGYKCYLIRKNNETRFAKKRKEIENCSNQTLALTNGAQYLMLTSSSVKFLQEKINSQLSEDGSKLGFDEIVDRFRCNFLVSGCKAFEEESWSKIFIRNQANVVKFMCSGLSNRCSMICVDKTGQKGLEPLRTLGT
uniref:MOSC domain-containing protein n=1 Tax=Ciona savignyi TaxID=51511 RepID=H2YX43_CIOSA